MNQFQSGIVVSVYDVVFSMIDKAAPKKKDIMINGDTVLDDIGMDSLEVLDMAMNLEEHYELFIPDKDIATFVTINDISDYLEQALSSKQDDSPSLESPDKEVERCHASDNNHPGQ